MHREEVFPRAVVDWIMAMVDSRVVSAGDLINKRLPIHPHYKTAPADELVMAVIGSMHAMPDAVKAELIACLRRTMGSEIDTDGASG